MKNYFISSIICCSLTFGYCQNNNQSTYNDQETVKIDSVMTLYFSLLDSALKGEKKYDESNDLDITEVNEFMEVLTEIDSKSDHNFLGILDITQETYDDWQKWYRDNKDKLIWEEDKKRVNRIDKNIYSYKED